MNLTEFDLQLFAEEAAASAAEPANTAAAPETGATGGTQTPAGETGGTILGQPTQENASEKQPDNGNTQQTAAVPDSYDFKGIVPEGMEYDEQSAKAFGEVAHKAGLSQEQATAVAQYGMQYMQQGVQAAIQRHQDMVAGWGQQARTELGGDFDATVAKAAAGINRLEQTVPGIRQALNETGAGNRVEFIRALAAVGSLVSEDGGHTGGQGSEKSIYPNTDFNLYH